MRSWARRSFDAATIFIALVICWVFLTERIRRRRSINEDIYRAWGFGPRAWGLRPPASGGGLSRCEVASEFLHRRVERGLQLIVQLLLLGDAAEDVRVARLDE